MAEKFISERAKFLPEKQRFFLERCQTKMHMTNAEFANFLKIHIRTFTDWKREKFLIPLSSVKKLCQKTHQPFPQNVRTRDKFSDVRKAARLGGIEHYKKYGRVGCDPEKRKQAWRHWWEAKGKFLPRFKFFSERKSIRIPFQNPPLAEFVGIMIGDGGITQRQVIITLNGETDREYVSYIKKLMDKLFSVKPALYFAKNDKSVDIVVSSTNLVEFCRNIGLKIGNKIKQNIDIPLWVKKKDTFLKTCIRGLFDTDGCLAIHRYRVNGKRYEYKKIIFSSAAPPLIQSVLTALRHFHFHPRLSKSGRQIWLDEQNEVKRYMSTIGTSNLKHENRFWRGV